MGAPITVEGLRELLTPRAHYYLFRKRLVDSFPVAAVTHKLMAQSNTHLFSNSLYFWRLNLKPISVD